MELAIVTATAIGDNGEIGSYEAAARAQARVRMAKKYLDEGEIDTLNWITVMFLDRAKVPRAAWQESRWPT